MAKGAGADERPPKLSPLRPRCSHELNIRVNNEIVLLRAAYGVPCTLGLMGGDYVVLMVLVHWRRRRAQMRTDEREPATGQR